MSVGYQFCVQLISAHPFLGNFGAKSSSSCNISRNPFDISARLGRPLSILVYPSLSPKKSLFNADEPFCLKRRFSSRNPTIFCHTILTLPFSPFLPPSSSNHSFPDSTICSFVRTPSSKPSIADSIFLISSVVMPSTQSPFSAKANTTRQQSLGGNRGIPYHHSPQSRHPRCRY